MHLAAFFQIYYPPKNIPSNIDHTVLLLPVGKKEAREEERRGEEDWRIGGLSCRRCVLCENWDGGRAADLKRREWFDG